MNNSGDSCIINALCLFTSCVHRVCIQGPLGDEYIHRTAIFGLLLTCTVDVARSSVDFIKLLM